MEKRKVVSYRQLPTKIGNVFWAGLILWLFLDRIQPRGWVWGAVGTVWLLLLVAAIVGFTSEESAEVKFKDEP